jgi:hypothetical protein
LDVSAVTEIHFTYDMYAGNQYKLEAWAKDFTPAGASVTIEKRVGPMNYTGFKKRGDLKVDKAQAAALLDVLSRYDIKGWSELPAGSSGSAPSRSLYVFCGEEMYGVAWNARFPKTLPPQEDVFYCELFNFFNGLIHDEPGWEEVRTDDLDDPRDNPAYGARKVTHFGNEVRLVPGTGVYYADGRGAEIDYGGRDWWREEGFFGVWELDPEKPQDDPFCRNVKEAALRVGADGGVTLELDDERWTGTLPSGRAYLSDIGVRLESGTARRSFTIHPTDQNSYAHLRVSAYPLPHPEEQFIPIDTALVKTD